MLVYCNLWSLIQKVVHSSISLVLLAVSASENLWNCKSISLYVKCGVLEQTLSFLKVQFHNFITFSPKLFFFLSTGSYTFSLNRLHIIVTLMCPYQNRYFWIIKNDFPGEYGSVDKLCFVLYNSNISCKYAKVYKWLCQILLVVWTNGEFCIIFSIIPSQHEAHSLTLY